MSAAKQDVLTSIVTLLRANDLTVDDLTAAMTGDRPAALTVAEFLPTVKAVTKKGSVGTYGTYWNLLVAELGDKALDAVVTSDLSKVAAKARANARRRSERRGYRGGQSAEENCVAAMRRFFKVAVDDRLVTSNPAADVPKPKRGSSKRRSLNDAELKELYAACLTTHDPSLDTLLFRFHLETGARRGGVLALTLERLDFERRSVLLCEKGETERWQPVSLTLLRLLAEHAESRGAVNSSDAVFRRNPPEGKTVGVPITDRHYDGLVDHWHAETKCAAKHDVTAHWLRHTAITTVERIAGFGVAQAFAGHAPNGVTTTTYIKAMEGEVAAAVALMTGEDHPLAVASE